MPASINDPSIQAAFAAAATQSTPSPADWRDQWIYFLLVDRFNNPTAPPKTMPYDAKCLPYQGGTLAGIKQQLPYLKKLGVGALWISPVLKNPFWFSDYYGGYAALDFLNIEPRFCSNPAAAQADPTVADKEFRDLVDAIHAQGMYVILDIVLNHAGNLFNYQGMRDNAPWKGDDPEYSVYWRNAAGVPQGGWTDIGAVPGLSAEAGVWPKELQRNDFFRRRGEVGPDVLRGDFYILKELVTEYLNSDGTFPVRNILIRAYQYLIAKFDLDAFRIDTLMYVERDFARVFGNSMREFAQAIGKKNFFTFGEVWKEDDETLIDAYHGRNTTTDDDDVFGVDAVLDFPIFKRVRNVTLGDAPPSDLANYFDYRKETQKTVVSSHGDSGRYFVTFLDNHDLPSRLYFQDPANPTAWDSQFTLALTLLYTLIGVPCLYYGSEQGLHGHSPANDQAREYAREALWGKPNPFDATHPFYKLIAELSRQRSTQPALRYGRQYFRELSGDGATWGYSPYTGGIAAFSRVLNDREIIIAANTAPTGPTQHVFVTADRSINPSGIAMNLLFSNQAGAATPDAVTIFGPRAATKVHLRPMEAQIFTHI